VVAVVLTLLAAFSIRDADESSATTDFWVQVWSIVISALISNVLMLPFKYCVPYMIAHINTVQTRTHVPSSVVRAQLLHVKRRVLGMC